MLWLLVAACLLEESSAWGPDGKVAVRAETVVSGLEVPWSFAFLPGGDVLISERPGRVRLLRGGSLVAQPVLTVQTGESSEGGLLGIAVQGDALWIYVTVPGPENQLQKWKLSRDHASATLDRVVLRGIAAGRFHDGGRIRFGPDGKLYIGTGDARDPNRSQDATSLNGKLLRMGDRGAEIFLSGIRNLEAFDWLEDGRLVLADHGPSGELDRRGHDEVSLAFQGDNLGWPAIYGCETQWNMVTPLISWVHAVPPGGLAVYRGKAIPQWRGSVLVASLRSEHLHRLVLSKDGSVAAHEVYFRGTYGRLREIAMTPSGELWVSTSNCDGRGKCGPQKDQILRIVPKQ